jgi:predicted  nucleic acid-binding Zn-ribbon protein
MSYYCTQCGTKVINEDSLFCHKCGAALAHAFAEEDPTPITLDQPEQSVIAADKPAKAEQTAIAQEPEESEESEQLEELEETQPPESKTNPATTPVKTKRAAAAVAAVVSVLLAVVLFAAITAGQSWFILQNGINNQTVKTVARAVVDEVNLSEISIPGFINERDVSIPGVETRTALPEAIYSTIDDYYREIFGVEKDHIQELLESEIFRNFLGGIIDDGIDYFMGVDEGSIIITSDKIVELIESNQEEIEEITSYSLVQSDFEDIKEVLRNSGLDDITWVSVTSGVYDAFLIRSVFSLLDRYSVVTLVVIIAAAVVIIVLIGILNRRRISNTLLYFGIPCIISGAGFVSGRLIGVDLLFQWTMRQLGIGTIPATVVRDAFSEAGDVILYTGLAVLGGGVIAVAVKIIVRMTAVDS